MSPTHSFTLTHQVPGTFESIYGTLFDFVKFGELHPYMQEVTVHEDRSPLYVEYNIIEEVYFLGIIKNRPTYKARVIEVEKNRHIRYTSQVKQNVALEIDLLVSQKEGNLVVVEESVKIRSNKFIAIIFAGILKKAHFKFFETLKMQNAA